MIWYHRGKRYCSLGLQMLPRQLEPNRADDCNVALPTSRVEQRGGGNEGVSLGVKPNDRRSRGCQVDVHWFLDPNH